MNPALVLLLVQGCELHVLCCGVGDRVKYMMRHDSTLPHISWGPCTARVPNVFDKLFVATEATWWRPTSNATKTECAKVAKSTKSLQTKSLPYAELHQHLHPDLKAEASAFQRMHRWHSYNTIAGIHIRAGNPSTQSQHASINNKEMEHIHGRSWGMFKFGWENRTQWLVTLQHTTEYILKTANATLNRLGYSANRAFFVSTDTPAVARYVQALADNVFSRNVKERHVAAHPMLWSNLHTNNAGEECKLNWFSDPIVDSHLLGESDVLFVTGPSGFTLMPERVISHKNGQVFKITSDGADVCTSTPEGPTISGRGYVCTV